VTEGLSAQQPFAGLRPFEFADRAYFFGRSEQVYALYRLTAFGFIAVIGSSGSGKSSLVRAGLFPLLLEPDDGKPWCVAVLRPGDDPLGHLADAVAGLAPGDEDEDAADRAARRDRVGHLLARSSAGLAEALAELPRLAGRRVLIVVDQFEELFRYAGSDDDKVAGAQWREKAASFVQLLLQLHRRQSTAHVMITMRSDFIGDCAQFPKLPEAVSDVQFLVPSLTRMQREEAIRGPIRKAGGTIEPGLVERLLNDVGYELDQLPVLQHCLARTWGHAQARSTPPALTVDDYRFVGEMDGAISQHADEIMRDLPGLEPVVEQVFRALCERDSEGRATRRALAFRRLVDETGMPEADVRRVVDRFRAADCSFLLPSTDAVPALQDETRIDVVHESLLRRWERITGSGAVRRGWLDDEDEDGRYYRSLLARIDGGETTLPLDRVEERYRWWTSRPRTAAWAERYGGGHDRVAQLFDDSRRALRQRRRSRQLLAIGTAVTAIAIITGIALAFVNSERARGASLVAQSQFLARDAEATTAQGDAVTGALYALEALPSDLMHPERPFTWRAELALEGAAANRSELRDLSGHRDAVWTVAFAPDGKSVVTASPDHTARIWDAATGALKHTLQGDDAIPAAWFSPDGTLVVTTSLGHTPRIWEAKTGTLRHTLRGHTMPARSAAFSRDGKWLVTGSDDRTARIWNVATGLTQFVLRGHDAPVWWVTFSPDGTHVATGSADGTARIWDARTGHVLRTLRDRDQLGVRMTVFAPDGTHLVTASLDETPRLWDVATGKLLRVLRGHHAGVQSVAFSPDGRWIATASDDDTAGLWDATTGALAVPLLRGNDGAVYAAAFAHDGTRVVTASADGTARIWDRASGAPLLVLRGHLGPVNGAAFSPDDSRIVSASSDHTARIWSSAPGLASRVLHGGDAPVRSGAFSPDGTRLVTAGDDGTAIVWDLATSNPVNRVFILHGDEAPVESAVFSLDGSQVVTASLDDVRVWNAYTGASLHVIKCCAEGVKSAAFSLDGRRIVTVAYDRTVRVYDATTASLVFVKHLYPSRSILPREQPGGGEQIASAAFSPDGRTIVTAYQTTASVWNSLTGEALLELRGHVAAVRSASFSPDGTRIVTASADGTARTWDAKTGAPLLVLRGGDGPLLSAAFSPDGQRIATAAREAARVWDAQIGASLFRLPGAAVTSVTFSFGGDRLATTSLDGSVRIWLMPARCQALIDQVRRTLPRQLTDDERRAEFLGPRPAAPAVDFFASQERCSG